MQKNRAENFTTVEVDPVNGEHYVIIPEWICDEKQWFEGTEVNIEVEMDGIVITEQEWLCSPYLVRELTPYR